MLHFLFWLFFSVQALHKKLLIGESFQRRGRAEGHFDDRYWHGDHEIGHAVWTLVHMCGSDDASAVRELVSDFISRVLLLLLLHETQFIFLNKC